MADIAEIFRSSLRALREMRGLTQGELGKRAGIAAASVSHFETGQRVPSLDSIVKLSDALEVSVDALLGRSAVGAGTQVDPLFLRASRANAKTLDTLRRITEALLDESQPQDSRSRG